jgi:hypothetical protein
MNDFVAGDGYEENVDTRALLDRHWKTLEAGKLDTEHWFYHDNAVLAYPQSGETIVGRDNIRASRAAGPRRSNLKVKSVIGQGDLWVTEYALLHDEERTFAVSIMEFRDGKVIHETLYLADPFPPPLWRTRFVSAKG